jgi:phospholipase C
MGRLFLMVSMMGIVMGTALSQRMADVPGVSETSTPIQHLVVIFQENVSFDHYFGSYPKALNPKEELPFRAAPHTPTVNGLNDALLNHNPNLNPANGKGAANPFRLDRLQAFTADMGHDYTPEQQAFDGGLMDLFPSNTGSAGPPPLSTTGPASTRGLVMGHFDGNTVTALWNYAQHYAMSDNSFGTTFGPSTVGAINLVSGQTNGVVKHINGTGDFVQGGAGSLTMIGDPDPLGDVCSESGGIQAQMGGQNIGDLLNRSGVTWGWFAGGFNLDLVNPDGSSGCKRQSKSSIAGTSADYVPHHQPFQYYASTANPTHARPSSLVAIGKSGDAAHHQYDLNDFFAAVAAGNFPAVSFLKAIAIQDGHAGNSDPLDEQVFVARVINFLQSQPEWRNTAVVILYDDSDGWYDHQIGPIVNSSKTPADALTEPGACGTGGASLPGIDSGNVHAQGRCGYGPRLPLLVISPWARHNFVDHSVTDQTSCTRFIEDNWLGGRRIGQGSFDGLANSINQLFDFTQVPHTDKFILNPDTGEPVSGSSSN